ncbi:MAG: heavy-metal-associated domain-containing protein [Thermoleophilia bacterium]|nr:heavy-metal-associated domain-containing protein [Thermoleophilia bacterium]
MDKLSFQVPGMNCGHCVEAVSTAVGQVEGVSSVDVDLDAKRVEVEGEGLAEAPLEQAINDAGYEVTAK